MTTDTVTPTRTSYEPDPALGTITAAIAVGGGVIAAVSLIAIWFGWFPGWYRFAPFPLVAFGWLLAIRFTRDDHNIAGRIAGLEMDCVDYEADLQRVELVLETRDTTITKLQGDVSHLQGLLANPQRSITISDRSGTRTEPLHARDTNWHNAMHLVRITLEDYGIVPGREKSGLQREAQADAISVLNTAKIIATNGNINRLTVPLDKAIDVLNWLAPDTSPDDVKLGAPSPSPEVAPSSAPSGGVAGEGS